MGYPAFHVRLKLIVQNQNIIAVAVDFGQELPKQNLSLQNICQERLKILCSLFSESANVSSILMGFFFFNEEHLSVFNY